MNRMFLCYTVSTPVANGAPSRKVKFPPKPVRNAVSGKETAKDTLKRYPRIMAELAK